MRLSVAPLLLVVLAQAWCCQAFIPLRLGVAAKTDSPTNIRLEKSTIGLRSTILILEESDDEEDTEKNSGKNSNTPQKSPDQEIRLVFDAIPMGSNLAPVEPQIEEWTEQLERNPAPPLTTTEMALLERLSRGNDAATELSKLWIHERGPNAANALKIAEGLVQSGAWQQAETVLTLMIQEEGVHFVAPMSQLATLYAMQGRLNESKALHQLVLQQKPWFLNSLLGIHDVCKKLGNDKEMIRWDRQLIPPMESLDRRKAWVDRMVARAKDSLNDAEHKLQHFFHKGCNKHGSEGSVLMDEEGSWQ